MPQDKAQDPAPEGPRWRKMRGRFSEKIMLEQSARARSGAEGARAPSGHRLCRDKRRWCLRGAITRRS